MHQAKTPRGAGGMRMCDSRPGRHYNEQEIQFYPHFDVNNFLLHSIRTEKVMLSCCFIVKTVKYERWP